MTTFAKTTFNASVYSASRPTYPSQLFDFIFKYHHAGQIQTSSSTPMPMQAGLKLPTTRSTSTSPSTIIRNGRWDRAVDLGCGTGQATSQLLPRFRNVVGVDPSPNMIRIARESLNPATGGGGSTAGSTPDINNLNNTIEFITGNAEDLRPVLENESADLIISAQACHWFDWTKVWPEVERVLRPGGTAAFWVYSEFRITNHENLTPLITRYAQGNDPRTSLGPHFQRPGRTILENHLLDVPNPRAVQTNSSQHSALAGEGKETNDHDGRDSNVKAGNTRLSDLKRVFFTGNHYPDFQQRGEDHYPVIMRQTMTWRDLLGYFRTWSSLHTFLELYPEDATAHGPDTRFPEDLGQSVDNVNDDLGIASGDIAVRFWKDLRAGVQANGGQSGIEDQVPIEWPIALILSTKI